MLRSEVLQGLLDLFKDPSYLEIGVCEGYTFHAVNASRKVAVDPKFEFDVDAAVTRNAGRNIHYHQITSDEYFAGVDPSESFDVIYLDGLHTFDQTLRDLLHAISYLKPGGVILIDDTFPNSYAAAIPDLPRSNAFREARGITDLSWMGDVYKLVFFIRDYMPSYRYATITDNHGQTAVWRGQRPTPTGARTVREVASIEYADMVFDEEHLNPMPFASVCRLLRP